MFLTGSPISRGPTDGVFVACYSSDNKLVSKIAFFRDAISMYTTIADQQSGSFDRLEWGWG
ncbi:hypothetical protein JCM18750_39010 [Halostagnicola bangensis]